MASKTTEPRKSDDKLQGIVVLILLVAALFVLLSRMYEGSIVNWAVGILGVIAGRYIKR
jgi:hypothetical protein